MIGSNGYAPLLALVAPDISSLHRLVNAAKTRVLVIARSEATWQSSQVIDGSNTFRSSWWVKYSQ